jgi:hypothetical protein
MLSLNHYALYHMLITLGSLASPAVLFYSRSYSNLSLRIVALNTKTEDMTVTAYVATIRGEIKRSIHIYRIGLTAIS